MHPGGFVGRVDELFRLVSAATGGTGRGLILTGSAGVGKTRLLREAVAALDPERVAVWTVSAHAATAGLPLGNLTPVLPAEQPPGLTPAGLLRWAAATLHQRAGDRPIVFAIDDAHLLDPVSATLVYLIARSDRVWPATISPTGSAAGGPAATGTAAHRLRSDSTFRPDPEFLADPAFRPDPGFWPDPAFRADPAFWAGHRAWLDVAGANRRVTVLGTLRSLEPVPPAIRALWTDGLVDQVELPPFTGPETAELLEQLVGGAFDPASADRLWRLSSGNPLLLRELVLSAQSNGKLTKAYGMSRWTGPVDLAPDLVELIDARIGQLPAALRALLELVAFGEPIGLPLLAGATGPGAVEQAEERGLIRLQRDDRRTEVRLGHPLYGEVVRGQCPARRRDQLLAELAGLVEKTGARRHDDPLRVAVWRLDSGTGRDPVQLLRAARLAFARYDLPLAERLTRAARQAGGGFDAAELLATILMFGNRPADAVRVLDAAQGEADTEEQLSRWLAVRALNTYWGLGRESTDQELSAAAGKITDPGHRGWLLAFESIMAMHRLACADARRRARGVLDRPAASVAAQALARSVIAHLQAVDGHLAGNARTVAAVDADAARWRTDAPYFQLAVDLARGTGLILGYDVTGVDAMVAAELADLFDAGDFRLGSGYLAVLRAQAARLRGRADQALRYSHQACAVLAEDRVFAGLAHAERAYAAALHGQHALAAEAMAESDRTHADTMAILYPWREQARAWVFACTGEIPTAVDILRGLLVRLRADGFAGHEVLALHDLIRLAPDLATETTEASPPDESPLRTDPSGTSGAAARVIDVVAIADRLATLTRTVDGPAVRLVAAHARALADRDGAGLMAVADQFADRELYLFAAEAAAVGVGHLRAARSTRLGTAIARSADLRARCPHLLSPALRPARPHLTRREHQVAWLAASGAPSKKIARELFLSSRTVDNHLLRVYAKLGIAGRAELESVLRAMPADTAEGLPAEGPRGQR